MKTRHNFIVSPYKQKGFCSALDVFIAENIPVLRGQLIRKPIVDAICKMVDEYYPATERMKMGQILWYAVDVNEKAG